MTEELDRQVERAQAAKERLQEAWLARPYVTNVDVGFKYVGGERTPTVAIRVHVRKKRPEDELPEEEVFPDEVDGVPVDVVEATYRPQGLFVEREVLEAAAAGRGLRLETVRCGVSVGNPRVTAGTLGARVYDLESGREMILSNWHVLCASAACERDEAIWQPGRLDGGRESDRVAALERWRLGGPADAAVALITGERPVEALTVEGAPIEDPTPARLGMEVKKSGRTTGLTLGMVDGVGGVVPMDYDGLQVRLERIVRIVPRPGHAQDEISQGGDSGSVWVESVSNRAVGLHFAGEGPGDPVEVALANDIQAVLEELRVGLSPPAAGRRGLLGRLWDRLLAWLRTLSRRLRG